MSRTPAYSRRRPATLLAMVLAACDAGRGPTDLVVSRLVIHGGNDQVAPAGALLPIPLTVRVATSSDKGVPGERVTWHITSGAGVFSSVPQSQPLTDLFTVTNAAGIAAVFFQPTVVGTSTVAASVAGLQDSPVTFTANATEPVDVVIRFSPLFDCTPPTDTSIFVGPENTSNATMLVGRKAEWLYMDWVHPSCTARITSKSVPPGGQPFDSGILGPGQRFQFIPGVAGTWKFVDAINGGSGTLTAATPP